MAQLGAWKNLYMVCAPDLAIRAKVMATNQPRSTHQELASFRWDHSPASLLIAG